MRRSAWKREKQSKGYSVSSCKWVSFYMVPNWCFRCDNVYFTQFFDSTKSLFQILFKFSRFTYSTFSTHLSFSLCTNSKCFEILIAIVASDTFAFSGNGYVCVCVCVWKDACQLKAKNAKNGWPSERETRTETEHSYRSFQSELNRMKIIVDYLMKWLVLNDSVHYVIANGNINNLTTKTMCEIRTLIHKHTNTHWQRRHHTVAICNWSPLFGFRFVLWLYRDTDIYRQMSVFADDVYKSNAFMLGVWIVDLICFDCWLLSLN